MKQSVRISLIAGVAIAISALMIPGTPLAFASHHHHHHHHHHNSVKIDQSNSQINVCDHSDCSNGASKSASVDLRHHSSNHVKIDRSNDQATICSNSDCSNSASNDASVS